MGRQLFDSMVLCWIFIFTLVFLLSANIDPHQHLIPRPTLFIGRRNECFVGQFIKCSWLVHHYLLLCKVSSKNDRLWINSENYVCCIFWAYFGNKQSSAVSVFKDLEDPISYLYLSNLWLYIRVYSSFILMIYRFLKLG